MKTSSAKAKGRRLQQWFAGWVQETFPGLEPDDVRSVSTSAGGEDIWLSPAAREVFPFSVECKNTERLNIWTALAQAEQNAGDYIPMVVFSRNRSKTYAVIEVGEGLRDLLRAAAARTQRTKG